MALPIVFSIIVCVTIALMFAVIRIIGNVTKNRDRINDAFRKDQRSDSGSGSRRDAFGQIFEDIPRQVIDALRVNVEKDITHSSVTINSSTGEPKIFVKKNNGKPGRVFEGFGMRVEKDADGKVTVNMSGAGPSRFSADETMPAMRCASCGAVIDEGERKCSYCDSPRMPG